MFKTLRKIKYVLFNENERINEYCRVNEKVKNESKTAFCRSVKKDFRTIHEFITLKDMECDDIDQLDVEDDDFLTEIESDDNEELVLPCEGATEQEARQLYKSIAKEFGKSEPEFLYNVDHSEIEKTYEQYVKDQIFLEELLAKVANAVRGMKTLADEHHNNVEAVYNDQVRLEQQYETMKNHTETIIKMVEDHREEVTDFFNMCSKALNAPIGYKHVSKQSMKIRCGHLNTLVERVKESEGNDEYIIISSKVQIPRYISYIIKDCDITYVVPERSHDKTKIIAYVCGEAREITAGDPLYDRVFRNLLIDEMHRRHAEQV